MRRILSLALCFAGVLCSAAIAGEADRSSVAQQLFTGEKNLETWADELENVQPETIDEAWDAMEVLLRAKRDEAVARLIPQAYALFPRTEWLGRYEPRRRAVVNLLENLPAGRGELFVTFFETFGDVMTPNENSDMVKLLQRMGWSPSQIATWVGERYRQALAIEPKREQSFSFVFANTLWPMTPVATAWHHLYLRNLSRTPEWNAALVRIIDDARQSPDDMKKLMIFLLSYMDNYADGIEPQDAGWLLETLDRRSAYQSWIIGRSLARVQNAPAIKEAFLKRAIELPLTKEECDNFRLDLQMRSSMVQPQRSDELIQAMFRVDAMDDLNRLYLKLERNDDAQRVMLEARELRKQHSLREGSLLAGTTQGASGERVVEAEIKAREALDETKPGYWFERAEYYRGRKELADEEAARRRALALFETLESRRENSRHDYRSAFSGLFRFLWQNERQDEALELFREHRAAARHQPDILWRMYYDCGGDVAREKRFDELEPLLAGDMRDAYQWLKTTPKADTDAYRNLARQQLDLLLRSPTLAVGSDVMNFAGDPFAWEILPQITAEYNFQQFVSLLIFPVPKSQKPDAAVVQKLEAIMDRGDFSAMQLYVIGAVLSMPDFYETANRFLLAATEKTQYESVKTRCYGPLIHNSLALGDWRSSEKYIDLCAKLGTLHGEYLLKTAEMAEHRGSPADAERIRKRIANLGATR